VPRFANVKSFGFILLTLFSPFKSKAIFFRHYVT